MCDDEELEVRDEKNRRRIEQSRKKRMANAGTANLKGTAEGGKGKRRKRKWEGGRGERKSEAERNAAEREKATGEECAAGERKREASIGERHVPKTTVVPGGSTKV